MCVICMLFDMIKPLQAAKVFHVHTQDDCQCCFLRDHHESNTDRGVKRRGECDGEGATHQSHVYMVLIKLWATKGQSVFTGVK